MNAKYLSLFLFITAYFLFFVLPSRRSLISFSASIIIVLSGLMTIHEAFWAINWNVMGIFVGMLFLAEFFIESRCPAFLASHLVQKTPSTPIMLIAICGLTSFISAFVENVATVLIIAPICLELARKIKIDPRQLIIAVAISSNLQGTATLIGDPPSMILAGHVGMNFLDFFIYHGKPGIFFAVQLGAITSIIFLYFVFKKYRQTETVHVEPIITWMPTLFIIILILLLVASSFFHKSTFYTTPGFICMLIALISVIWALFQKNYQLFNTIKKLDWGTTVFLIGVFILVATIDKYGWTEEIADFIHLNVGENIIVTYWVLIITSIILSGFIDNVPYLAAMLPISSIIAEKSNQDPTLLYFGLLIGASLGGNITPFGASANVVGYSILEKEGYPVTFWEWCKISIPFTMIAVIPSAIFILIVWSR